MDSKEAWENGGWVLPQEGAAVGPHKDLPFQHHGTHGPLANVWAVWIYMYYLASVKLTMTCAPRSLKHFCQEYLIASTKKQNMKREQPHLGGCSLLFMVMNT